MEGGSGQRKVAPAISGVSSILNCAAEKPFLPTLADAILKGEIWNTGAPRPHDLARLTVYLPTHGAVEPLKRAFLALSPNRATFLPRIRVLGDVDPLDLFATFGAGMASARQALRLLAEALAVPEAFDDLERRLELGAIIQRTSQSLQSTAIERGELLFANIAGPAAYTTAKEIAALIDGAGRDGAALSGIETREDLDRAGSEQIALQLLRAVLRAWRDKVARAGKLDREDRRTRLMAIEAAFIRQSNAPVIVAGSTGSIVATVSLMQAALSRPNAAIVLHGLDLCLDCESWDTVGEHPEHPQHGLHHLLARLGVPRDRVRDLAPSSARDREGRVQFLSQALRPASTTAQWEDYARQLRQSGSRPLKGFTILEADTIQEEAAAIALILREALETPGQRAALVTPDDMLLRRVGHALARRGVSVPSFSGNSARYSAAIAQCAAMWTPDDFVALLRSANGAGKARARRFAELIDLGVLRQMWKPVSADDLTEALARAEHAVSAGEARHPALKRIAAKDWENARAFSADVIKAFTPLVLERGHHRDLRFWAKTHAKTIGHLSGMGLLSPASRNAASSLLEGFSGADASEVLSLDIRGYARVFALASAEQGGRAEGDGHPRLSLWSPLDARLASADVMILGGLNEGCWPQAARPDPWLGRSGQAALGLSAPERRIGQAAHDFTMFAASGAVVYLTRSRKMNGSLARPSRWLSRMTALAAGADMLGDLKRRPPYMEWLRKERMPDVTEPPARPRPCPPLAARPRRLSVTAIETWFANPYAIYARHILGLDPLRQPRETNDARDKGILYHAALHRFFQAFPRHVPENASAILLSNLDRAAEDLGFNLENAPFWRPRFARFAIWFAAQDLLLRTDLQTMKSEAGGKLRLEFPAGPFEVTARADRIDVMQDGSVRIYDFKTSANAAKTSSVRGAPQLSLEGLLVLEGAFAGITSGGAAGFAYIVASGGEPPGEIVKPKFSPDEAIQAARVGLISRITRFDQEATPYAYETRSMYRDKSERDPYAHLARAPLWSSEGAEDEVE